MISNDEKILKAAVSIAKTRGLHKVTRDTVAKKAGVAAGTVNGNFGTMAQLKHCVMRYAVANEILRIIAIGLTIKHPLAMSADDELKRRAVDSLLV